MKLNVIKLDGGAAGSVDLGEEIFGLEPRVDILHRVVRWQRNKAQAGTHKVKTRSETSYSTKKIYRQKGTGGALYRTVWLVLLTIHLLQLCTMKTWYHRKQR